MNKKKMTAVGLTIALAVSAAAPALPVAADTSVFGSVQTNVLAAQSKTTKYYAWSQTKKDSNKFPYIEKVKIKNNKMVVTGHLDTKENSTGLIMHKTLLKKKTYHFTLSKKIKYYAVGGDAPAEKVTAKYFKSAVNRHTGLGITITKKGNAVTKVVISS